MQPLDTSESVVQPGGFLLPTTPHPTDGTAGPSSSANSQSKSILPEPRAHALKPGGAKAQAVADYAEAQLLHISGQYERRFERMQREKMRAADEENNDDASEHEKSVMEPLDGYASYTEVASDLGRLVDVLWVTGTPSLQIPFLLTLALSASDYLTSFPFAASPTFTLLSKLDLAFSTLLGSPGLGASTANELRERYSEFGSGRRLTMTEKVRLRGIVESTRNRVARQASEEEWETADIQITNNKRKAVSSDVASPSRKRREVEVVIPDSESVRETSEVELVGEGEAEEDQKIDDMASEDKSASAHEMLNARDTKKANQEQIHEGDGVNGDGDDGDDSGDAEEDDENNAHDDSPFTSWEIRVARVYERTIIALGSLLDAQESIGIQIGPD